MAALNQAPWPLLILPLCATPWRPPAPPGDSALLDFLHTEIGIHTEVEAKMQPEQDFSTADQQVRGGTHAGCAWL